tara:strand:- start:29 stop:238 length:210 start_codon:yes stop_codon:yes gene_type:complete
MQLNSLRNSGRPITFDDPIHVAVRPSWAMMEEPDARSIHLRSETEELIWTAVSPEGFVLLRQEKRITNQ